MIIRDHIKLRTEFGVNYNSVINHTTKEQFDKTTQNKKWTKHSHEVASYFSRHRDSWCLNVATCLQSFYENIYILHWEEEEKKLRIPMNGEMASLNGNLSYQNHFVMLQLEGPKRSTNDFAPKE